MGCTDSTPPVESEDDYNGRRRSSRKKGRKKRRKRRRRKKTSSSSRSPDPYPPDNMMPQDPYPGGPPGGPDMGMGPPQDVYMEPRGSMDGPTTARRTPSPYLAPAQEEKIHEVEKVTYTAPKKFDLNNDGILDAQELALAKQAGEAVAVKRTTVARTVERAPEPQPKYSDPPPPREPTPCEPPPREPTPCEPPKEPTPCEPEYPTYDEACQDQGIAGAICFDEATCEYKYFQNGRQVGVVDRDEAERLSKQWPRCVNGRPPAPPKPKPPSPKPQPRPPKPEPPRPRPPPPPERHEIDKVTYSAPAAYDVNNDGILDANEMAAARAHGVLKEERRTHVGSSLRPNQYQPPMNGYPPQYQQPQYNQPQYNMGYPNGQPYNGRGMQF